MKQTYLLTTFLFFLFIKINAQTISVTDSCDPDDTDGIYTLSVNINDRPSYVNNMFTIQWSITRWELILTSDPSVIGMYNNLDTPTPPSTSLSPWISELCDPSGVFSGEGTTSVLSLSTVKSINQKLNIYPTPSSKYISVSGLEKKEHYIIYNYLGTEIIKGTISDKEKIDIQNISNGLYLLKLSNSNTLKFVKK